MSQHILYPNPPVSRNYSLNIKTQCIFYVKKAPLNAINKQTLQLLSN